MKQYMISYILSSIVFTISYIIYFAASLRVYIQNNTTDNCLAMIANMFCVIAYVAYIYECKLDSKNPKAVPFLTRPPEREPLLPL